MNPTGRLKEVTIQGAGEPDRAFGAERNSLCFSELILLIDELAEMRHPPEVVRFEGFRASSDTIRLLEYTRARRLSPRVRLSFSDLSVEAVEEISGETGAIIVIPIEGSIGRSGGDKPIRVAEHAASVGIDLEIETLLRPLRSQRAGIAGAIRQGIRISLVAGRLSRAPVPRRWAASRT